jgi:hypothetical protein
MKWTATGHTSRYFEQIQSAKMSYSFDFGPVRAIIFDVEQGFLFSFSFLFLVRL